MKTKQFFSGLLMAAAIIFSVSAYAAPTLWDNQWLAVDLSVTLPKNKGIDHGQAYLDGALSSSTLKYNSGKCFMNIADSAQPGEYVGKTFCNLSGSVWELASTQYLYFAGADNVIGHENPGISMPISGQSVEMDPKIILRYEGTVILNAKVSKDVVKVVKSVTFSSAQGIFFIDNQVDGIYGSTRSGNLKIKLAKPDDITQELRDCLASTNGGTPVANCQ